MHSISIAGKRKRTFTFVILLPDWLRLAFKVYGSVPLLIKCLNSGTHSAISMKVCIYMPTRLRKKCRFKSVKPLYLDRAVYMNAIGVRACYICIAQLAPIPRGQVLFLALACVHMTTCCTKHFTGGGNC